MRPSERSRGFLRPKGDDSTSPYFTTADACAFIFYRIPKALITFVPYLPTRSCSTGCCSTVWVSPSETASLTGSDGSISTKPPLARRRPCAAAWRRPASSSPSWNRPVSSSAGGRGRASLRASTSSAFRGRIFRPLAIRFPNRNKTEKKEAEHFAMLNACMFIKSHFL